MVLRLIELIKHRHVGERLCVPAARRTLLQETKTFPFSLDIST